MNTSAGTNARVAWVAVRAVLVGTLALGVAYTALVAGVAQIVAPSVADGSRVARADGTEVGSALIGQAFTDGEGHAIAEYFQSRPSLAGDGYDAQASGGSNQGPEHPELIAVIAERRAAIASREGVSPTQVPADAVTASASGLDPHISPEYARLQASRVAAARGLPLSEVEEAVAQHTETPDLGIWGMPRVNVLQLNLDLDERKAGA